MEGSHDTADKQSTTTASKDHTFMSWEPVLYVTKLEGIAGSERLVLLKLAEHASRSDGGNSFVGVSTIADWMGVSIRQVQRILGDLLAAGRIVVEGSNGRRGGRRSTTYRVVLPDGFDAKQNGSKARTGKREGLTPSTDARGDTRVAKRVTPMSPEPKTLTQESNHSLRSWRPSVRLARSEMRKHLYSQETVRVVMDLTDRPFRQAKNLIGELAKVADVKHPERVFEAIQAAIDGRPIDGAPWLLAYCRRTNWRGIDHDELQREVIKASCPDRYTMTAAQLDAYADRELARRSVTDHAPSAAAGTMH